MMHECIMRIYLAITNTWENAVESRFFIFQNGKILHEYQGSNARCLPGLCAEIRKWQHNLFRNQRARKFTQQSLLALLFSSQSSNCVYLEVDSYSYWWSMKSGFIFACIAVQTCVMCRV
eukprot:262318_1